MDTRILNSLSLRAIKFTLSFLFALSLTHTRAEEAPIVRAVSPNMEQSERAVDEVAAQSQEKSIATLRGLLKKYRGTRQEPVFLIKLAELESQNAAIKFRLAHGAAHRSKNPADFSAYKKSMKSSVSILSELMGKYPHYEEIPHAYFLRGKCYEELDDVKSATRDYLHLTKTYPDWEETTPAYMSLAEFSIKANDHIKAIHYLNQVEKKPDHPLYPFALYKLAWSHYNLKNIPRGLGFLEQHNAYLKERKSKQSSDEALRENTLLDSTLFYVEGFNQKLPEYPIQTALGYFRKLEDGPILGKMLVKFSRLLRSQGYEIDLIAWKNMVLKEESKRPETMDVVLTAFEFFFNKRRFKELVDLTGDIVDLHNKFPEHRQNEALGRARKMLLETAENIQATVIKNKKAEGVRELSGSLAKIYDAFTRVVPESDPRIPKVHYNLAETLFEIHDYEGATQNYRWVYDRDSKHKDASLRAIASRYEALKEKKLIPDKVVAQNLTTAKERPLDLMVVEWIKWIDTHRSAFKEEIEDFYFESNRTLYAEGHVQDSLDRLHGFAKKQPKSKFAIPSATLALDTWIESQMWEKVRDHAHDYIDWKIAQGSPAFATKLRDVASDALYKTTEATFHKKDFTYTLSQAKELIKEYPGSPRLADTLWIAALSSKERELTSDALEFLGKLLDPAQEKKQAYATYRVQALTLRSDLHLSRFDFENSAQDLKALLELSPPPATIKDKAPELRKKLLKMAWISGSRTLLKSLLDSKSVCETEPDCETYQALWTLGSVDVKAELDPEIAKKAFDRARKGPEKFQSLWAAVALHGSKPLAWRDRLVTLRQLTKGHDELDPLIQLAILPYLTISVPRTFEFNRAQMGEVGPLRADPRYITRRVEVIKEMENMATKLMKLPWSRIRSHILITSAELYLDLSKGISSLPAPKNLSEQDMAVYEDTIRKIVIPFEEKGQDMKAKAFEMASHFSIEDESFKEVSESYFRENASMAQRLKPDFTLGALPKLSIEWLQKMDPDTRWAKAKTTSNDLGETFRAHWGNAIRAKNHVASIHFIQEAKQKGLISEISYELARAVTLSSFGARGEALALLKDVLEKLPPGPKRLALDTLLRHSVLSLSIEGAKSAIKAISELEKVENPEPKVQAWISKKR